jgi:F420-dependent oxidoreductase-like protein
VNATEQIAAAERLGFDTVWTAEAYGSDAFTPLAWWGASTSRIRLGTAIAQMSARTPTATAMAAITLDHLSGGRFVLGLGASGPQVVEGWYGQPYPRPLERTREYVDIVRQVFRREAPVELHGRHYDLPLRGGAGLGKALKPTVHPLRSEIPIFLGAEGPKNVALSAEICDGWIPFWFSPKSDAFYRAALESGFDAAGKTADQRAAFEVAAVVPVVIGDDVETCANMVRPMIALYAGGMGAREANFHFDVFARMGWEDVCVEVQNLFLAGKKTEAMAAIPLEMVEDVALVGPVDKISREADAWKATCLTSIVVGGSTRHLEMIAEIFA